MFADAIKRTNEQEPLDDLFER